MINRMARSRAQPSLVVMATARRPRHPSGGRSTRSRPLSPHVGDYGSAGAISGFAANLGLSSEKIRSASRMLLCRSSLATQG